MPATPPQRIQRKRITGWRMPDGAVYVGRGTKWGNPFRVYRCTCCPVRRWDVIDENLVTYAADHRYRGHLSPEQLRREHARCLLYATELFAEFVAPALDVSELRGKHLACWCDLESPCHADVLLSLANEGV